MDLPYDQTQDNAFGEGREGEQKSSLEDDLQEAYRAFSASPWGARIGGFLGNVVKQGGTVYNEAQQEFAAIGQDASKGLTGLRDSLISRTRSLSLNTSAPQPHEAGGSSGGGPDKDGQTTPTGSSRDGAHEHEVTALERLREQAARRLRDIQRAEDAADEALLKFGANVRDFLQNAISIAPPPSGATGQAAGAVRFESKDAQGKRVIHASRYDAQLHVVHTSVESFKKDPAGAEYQSWCEGFDVDKKTDDISADLTAYPDLRATMEKVVPDTVPYADFWKRYYFLRHGIEAAEARRRDLLKAASADDEVKWDDDSEEDDEEEEEEEEEEPKPKGKTVEEDEDEEDDEDDDDDTEDDDTDNEASVKKPSQVPRPGSSSSSTTTVHPSQRGPAEARARKSNDEKSQAGSEASYDVVGAASGAPSRASESPTDTRKAGGDSDSEDDWE